MSSFCIDLSNSYQNLLQLRFLFYNNLFTIIESNFYLFSEGLPPPLHRNNWIGEVLRQIERGGGPSVLLSFWVHPPASPSSIEFW